MLDELGQRTGFRGSSEGVGVELLGVKERNNERGERR